MAAKRYFPIHDWGESYSVLDFLTLSAAYEDFEMTVFAIPLQLPRQTTRQADVEIPVDRIR